jgi:hypothetical protein
MASIIGNNQLPLSAKRMDSLPAFFGSSLPIRGRLLSRHCQIRRNGRCGVESIGRCSANQGHSMRRIARNEAVMHFRL